MNKCPQCGAVLRTLTRVCEACGSELKPEALASSASANPRSEDLGAAELSAQINDSLSSLKANPPSSKLKSFVIGLFMVPTVGLIFLGAKVMNVFGRMGHSPERVKLALDQDLRTAETRFKSDPEMKSLIERGRADWRAYQQAQQESRGSLIFGVVASILICAAIPLVLEHEARVNAQKEAAATQLRAQQAAGMLAQTPPTNFDAQTPAQPNALVVAFTLEPKAGNRETKMLEDLVTARVAKLGFTTLTRDLAVDSISRALKQPDSEGTVKILLEQFSTALQGPAAIEQNLADLLDEQNSVVRLAQAVNANLIILVTIDSFGTEKHIFKGNDLAPVATTTTVNNLLVSYRLAFAASGAAAAGDSVRVTRTRRDTDSVTEQTDNLPDDMLDEAATDIADKITASIRK